ALGLRDLRAGAGTSYVVSTTAAVLDFAPADLVDPDQTTIIADTLNVSARVAAWQAAADMWSDHMFFGVSLGNGYRYIGIYLPDWALTSALFSPEKSEGDTWLDPNSPEKGNAKNFLFHLLAETGAFGTILFGAFFFRHIFFAPAGERYYDTFRL